MSLYPEAVGGIGFDIDEELRDKFIEAGVITQEQWDDRRDEEIMAEYGCRITEHGNYSHEVKDCLLLDISDMSEYKEASEKMFKAFGKFGIALTEKDLKVFSELLLK